MTYCLNPHCQHPHNFLERNQCQSCGKALFLKDQYQALSLLGQGGFGRTFRAVKSENHQPCVIKQLVFPAQNLEVKRKVSALFAQEAQRLQCLGVHPQIPQFYDYVEQESYPYLIQEYRPGEDLENLVRRQGKWFSDRPRW